ncbi:MAG: hypothetical protein CM1200mP10_26010 [Candidatus Neomarinimicrobiota bacterium]|nr:MAG: hypothetical protein CM1200mP10_26010 [Candidatus Neomarinimicrobiota bacterium]
MQYSRQLLVTIEIFESLKELTRINFLKLFYRPFENFYILNNNQTLPITLGAFDHRVKQLIL